MMRIEPTPNPNAQKFILDKVVKADDKSSYRCVDDCPTNPMAQELFTIRGIDQVHFFQNVITLSKFGYEEWDTIEKAAEEIINRHLPDHDPNYQDPDPEAERRQNLPPELQKIEEILDQTIRPGLQADGGDLQCLSYKDNILIIKYEGACGKCPSSQMGTLHAINQILQEQYNPEIEVYAAPEI